MRLLGYPKISAPATGAPVARPHDRLDPEHLDKLRASTLSDATIDRTQAYTERDTGRLRFGLRNQYVRAPALVLPGFDRHGNRNGYDVARFMPPHVRHDGKPAKYLAPAYRESRVYFPPFPCVWEALADPRGMLVAAEGVLKALAAAQAGIPCIGIAGFDNWHKARPKDARNRCHGPYVLTDDLQAISWAGRTVVLVRDTDGTRKPGVHNGAAELGMVLTGRGARVLLPRLPLGPMDADGQYGKTGLDDFVVRHGAEALRDLVRGWLAPAPARSLQEYRADMRSARRASVAGGYDAEGTYLDRSPTGAGKSHADALLLTAEGDTMDPAPSELSRVMRNVSGPPTLTLAGPSHANCNEVVGQYAAVGVGATAYPRLDDTTCARYDEAAVVMGRGLPVMSVLCPDCPFQGGCAYHGRVVRAGRAHHAVATHARGKVSMRDLVTGRKRLMIHEDAVGLLRPALSAGMDLRKVVNLADAADAAADSIADSRFFKHMRRIARDLDRQRERAKSTVWIDPMPEPAGHVPGNLYRLLNELMDECPEAQPPAEALQLVLAAALGELHWIAVQVDDTRKPKREVIKARGKAPRLDRPRTSRPHVRVVGVSRTNLPADSLVWVNDATAHTKEIAAALGRPMVDATPRGRLLPEHPVVQIPLDVTRRTKAARVLPVLRGLLYDLPYRSIGLLTHSNVLEPLLKMLPAEDYRRIAMHDYFGGKKARGSNDWYRACDALIVLGTPRVRPSEVRRRLIQLGNVRAARLTEAEAGWDRDYWSGVTATGARLTVRTPHYADHDWHAAYLAIVRSALVQAVGRGRGILPDGVPVVLVSTENMAPPDEDDGIYGFPLDDTFQPLTDAQARVLDCLRRSDGGRIVRMVGKAPEIAEALGIDPRSVRGILHELQAAGRVRKVGSRSGWVATDRRRNGG